MKLFKEGHGMSGSQTGLILHFCQEHQYPWEFIQFILFLARSCMSWKLEMILEFTLYRVLTSVPQFWYKI